MRRPGGGEGEAAAPATLTRAQRVTLVNLAMETARAGESTEGPRRWRNGPRTNGTAFGRVEPVAVAAPPAAPVAWRAARDEST